VSVQLAALLANIGLALMKFIVGSLARSRALIADAFNSAGDVVATFVAWIAFRYGMKPPDEDHHYGHANAEALAGLLIGGMLCATGAFICINGILSLVEERVREAPDSAALYAAGLTAFVKEVLYRVSMRVGRKTNSPTLLASARDHRADVVSSLVALGGIWIARSGYPEVDSIAACLIGLYIFWLGFDPVQGNTAILMHGAPPELARDAGRIAAAVDGVVAVRTVRVLPTGGQYRMDMTLEVRGELTVTAAHEIAHRAEDAILEKVPLVTEVHVHVEPEGEPGGEPQ
jgi:cation diffusion facilitator family transporter